MTSEQPPRVRFLTVAEVAEVMRVSKMTVYRLLHSGEMPAVRVGRSFRVPQDALDHYLATARLDLESVGDADEGGPRAGRLSS